VLSNADNTFSPEDDTGLSALSANTVASFRSAMAGESYLMNVTPAHSAGVDGRSVF